MNSPDLPPADELLALCDQMLDGDLSPEGRLRIESLVLGQPELRRLYVEYLQLHATLRQQSSLLAQAPLKDVLQSVPARPAWARSSPAWIWKAAAAFLLGTGLMGVLSLVRERAGMVATLSDVQGARWDNSSLPTEPGSALTSGKLRLAEGLARLTFRSGAELTLEGPAELDLIDATTCHLRTGALVAHVPPAARGFTVLTTQARLIDHGTDFGITADVSGNATVHVMKGEVELQHAKGGVPVHLTTQQMASITPENLLPASMSDTEPRGQWKPSPAAESRFTHEVTSASGKGAAAYVTSPGTKIHFSNTLLLLKNAPSRTFLRKSVLRFDLGSLPRQTVEDARLTLNFDVSGYGFASLGGDAVFAVYGVTDDTQDAWDPATVNWNTLPAFAADAGRVDEQMAIKLGTFTMPRGVLRGAYSIEGATLAQYLNRDGNRLATLIVVRENPLSEAEGVVHGFAGNHHPSLPPPALRLRFKPS